MTTETDPVGAASGSGAATVVGIGGSAGSLDALHAFFGAIPAGTGMAFVVVVHLAPDRESSLAEILQNWAHIPIRQVTGRVRMEPDHVYVMPPDRQLVVQDGHLALTAFEEERWRRAPITRMFETLAETWPEAIGILLSGGGSDGTLGFRALKAAGGVLMAQAPEEAEHDAMPRAAIATGLVDFVLPAAELAAKVLDLHAVGARIRIPEKPEELGKGDQTQLEDLLERLRVSTGHDFSGYKRSTVLRRLARRMRVRQTEDLASYLHAMEEHPDEAHALLHDLLISVTGFFRDPEVWDVLERDVVPHLFEGKTQGARVRAWVAGCATGEEAYTVAMLLIEHAETLNDRPEIGVFASDVDEAALGVARRALYDAASASEIREARLKRFFVADDGRWHPKKVLRDIVLFSAHNLLRDPPFSNLDLVSCRNLLIYLERDLQDRVLQLFHYALRPGGYLLLGTAETAQGAPGLFRVVDAKNRIYQRRETSGPRERVPDLPLQAQAKQTPPAASRGARPPGRLSEREQHEVALERYAPPSVLVGDNHDIVHLSESAGRYLRFAGGTPSHDVRRAVRKELRRELRAALELVSREGRAVWSPPVGMELEGERRRVQLLVRPTGDSGALVLFVESDPGAEEEEAGAAAPQADEVGRLEGELQRTYDQLQRVEAEQGTAEEEMKAANEDLRSVNEEYRTTLEEFETSKEELQSVNEELQTVNSELAAKLDQLARAHNDLKNLLASTDVATMFLDRDLTIQRFTPQVARLFNILDRDLGRPISHVTHRLKDSGIASDAQRVLDTLEPAEREVRDEDGRSYLLRLLPYRTTENQVDGVVVTLVDISVLTEARERLRASEERLRLVIESVHEYAIFTLDAAGRVTTWNPGAQRIFGYPEDAILGRHYATLFTREDQEAGAPAAEMAQAASEGHASDERWRTREDGTRFWTSGVLTALRTPDGALQGFAIVLRDNTAQQEAHEALEQSRAHLAALNETLEQRVAARTEELERSNRDLEHFAHAVSHDMRGPLGILISYAGLLRKRHLAALPPDAVACLEAIEGGGERMGRMLDGLLRLARVGRREAGRDEVPLDEVVGEVRRDLAPILAETGGEVRHGALPTVLGDHELLVQLFENLIGNSLKYRRPDAAPRIEVRHRGSDGRVEIEVADNGTGIAAADLPRVFDMFTRAPQDAGSPGEGIGLAIVKRIVEHHGGDITVTSQVGHGTTFRFTLPAAPTSD